MLDGVIVTVNTEAAVDVVRECANSTIPGRSARSLGPLLGHRCDHVADRHRRPDLRLVDRSGAEAVGESLRGDTDGGGFPQPS